MKVCRWRKRGWWGGGVQRKMEPPSKGTTLMYDYTVVLLEPLHRSSQSLSLLLSIKAHFAAKSSIFHLMSFLTLLFFSNLSAISVNCAAGGLDLFWSVFLEPNKINGTCACCAIKAFSLQSCHSCWGSPPRSALPAPFCASFIHAEVRWAQLFLEPNPHATEQHSASTGLCFCSTE